MLSDFIENLTWPSQPFTVISQFFLKIKHCKNCNSHINKIHRHKLTMTAIVNVNANSNVNISVCFSSLFFVFLYFCLFTLLLTKTNEMSLPYYSLVLFVKNCAMLITLITYNVSILLLGVVFKNDYVCQQKKVSRRSRWSYIILNIYLVWPWSICCKSSCCQSQSGCCLSGTELERPHLREKKKITDKR